MSDQRSSDPNPHTKPVDNAGAFMGPDIMIPVPSHGLGRVGDPSSESDVERKGGPRRLRAQSLLDRLLNRHPDEPAA